MSLSAISCTPEHTSARVCARASPSLVSSILGSCGHFRALGRTNSPGNWSRILLMIVQFARAWAGQCMPEVSSSSEIRAGCANDLNLFEPCVVISIRSHCRLAVRTSGNDNVTTCADSVLQSNQQPRRDDGIPLCSPKSPSSTKSLILKVRRKMRMT